MSARRRAALPSSVLTISSLLLTVLGGGVGSALGNGAAGALDPQTEVSTASTDSDDNSGDSADEEAAGDDESTDPNDLFSSEHGADAVLNVESPLISFSLTRVRQMTAEGVRPREVETPDGVEVIRSRGVIGLAAVTLKVDSIEDSEGGSSGFAVLTPDMIEPDAATADALVLNKWMVIERPLPAERTEGDYSWVWDQDVLMHGDFTQDMLKAADSEDTEPGLSADDEARSVPEERCIDVYINGSPCDEYANDIVADTDYTVTIDFAEHVDSKIGDTIDEPGEYALVATADKPGLGHIFGLADMRQNEREEGDLFFSSHDISVEEGLTVTVRRAENVDNEDTDDIESEEYWTDERMENAKPQPMPTVEDEDRALNIWTVGTTVIALLVVAALIALLYWQRLPYRRIRHVEEADEKE